MDGGLPTVGSQGDHHIATEFDDHLQESFLDLFHVNIFPVILRVPIKKGHVSVPSYRNNPVRSPPPSPFGPVDDFELGFLYAPSGCLEAYPALTRGPGEVYISADSTNDQIIKNAC
jgi:hypothetical protein